MADPVSTPDAVRAMVAALETQRMCWDSLRARAAEALRCKLNPGGQQAGTPEFIVWPISSLKNMEREARDATGLIEEALAAWRTRVPLADDVDIYGDAVDARDAAKKKGEAGTLAVLAFLDARLGAG